MDAVVDLSDDTSPKSGRQVGGVGHAVLPTMANPYVGETDHLAKPQKKLPPRVEQTAEVDRSKEPAPAEGQAQPKEQKISTSKVVLKPFVSRTRAPSTPWQGEERHNMQGSATEAAEEQSEEEATGGCTSAA